MIIWSETCFVVGTFKRLVKKERAFPFLGGQVEQYMYLYVSLNHRNSIFSFIFRLHCSFASKCASRPSLPAVWPSQIDPERLRRSLSRKVSNRIKKSRELSGESGKYSSLGRASPTVTKHFKVWNLVPHPNVVSVSVNVVIAFNQDFKRLM